MLKNTKSAKKTASCTPRLLRGPFTVLLVPSASVTLHDTSASATLALAPLAGHAVTESAAGHQAAFFKPASVSKAGAAALACVLRALADTIVTSAGHRVPKQV